MRVNGISAGPIKTLAASGIKGFGKILLSVVAEASPIRRNVTIEDVGNVAAFLLSDLAAGVTAEITYVDGGFSHVAGRHRRMTAGIRMRSRGSTAITSLPHAIREVTQLSVRPGLFHQAVDVGLEARALAR